MSNDLARSLLDTIHVGGNAYSLLQKSSAAGNGLLLSKLFKSIEDIGSEYTYAELATVSVLLRRSLPGDEYIRQLTNRHVSRSIKSWHWSMLHDQRRNEAYLNAIRASVSSTSVVLEIGTGSGVFSIAAAKAGAKHVFTCEANPELARVAGENIRNAGFSDRITVVNKDLEELRLDRDISMKCNVLLFELLDGGLVGEGVLETIGCIQQELVEVNTVFLPNRLFARVQGVSNTSLLNAHRAPEVEGIDLSEMDILAPSFSRVNPFRDVDVVGSAQTIIEFHATEGGFKRVKTEPIMLSSLSTGGAVGFIQWIGFSFPDGSEFENCPGTLSHWKWRFYPLTGDATLLKDVVLECEISDRQLLLFPAA